MRTIAKLFGHGPFLPLQRHMDKVAACVVLVEPAMDAYLAGDSAGVEELSKKISRLEHEADQLKYDIHTQLTSGLFLPVDRERLLEILSIQDKLADKAENLAVLLTLKQTPAPRTMLEQVHQFLAKNLEAFEAVRQIVFELEDLLSAGFGGAEAQKVRRMVLNVSRLEFEADQLQHRLLKLLFANETKLSVPDFFLWDRILKQLSELSNLSERLAHRIERTLEMH